MGGSGRKKEGDPKRSCYCCDPFLPLGAPLPGLNVQGLQLDEEDVELDEALEAADVRREGLEVAAGETPLLDCEMDSVD